MKYVAIYLIRLYKRLRPLNKLGRCIYRPSCTEYAMEAFERHGFVRGLVLTRARLLRCNEFAESAFDPVPLVYRSSGTKRKDMGNGEV